MKAGPAASRPVRILVADDLPAVREGLRRMLEMERRFQVVGEARSSGAELQKALLAQPDIILLGVKTPEKGVAGAIRRIREKTPGTRVIVLTLLKEKGVVEALRAGAAGYLLKDATREEILRAIDQVIEGKPYLDPSLGRHLSTQFAALAQVRLGLGLSPLFSQQRGPIPQGAIGQQIASPPIFEPPRHRVEG